MVLSAKGYNVTQTAKAMGITRQHCSNVIRKKAVRLLASKFDAVTLQRPYRMTTSR